MQTKKILLTLLLSSMSWVGVSQAKKWTLEECVDYAVQHNISIKQTELDRETATVTKKDAMGRFLPTINGQASHSWNIGLNQNITTGLFENQTTQYTSAGLSVGLDIYKGLQNQNQLRKANLSRVAADYQLTKMQEDISLNVVNAYLQILFNKENLKVQMQQLELDTKQLARTTELVDAGVVPKGDLLDVKATLATDNQRVIAAENALLISKLSLGQLLQLDNFKDFDIAESEVTVNDSPVLLENPETIYTKAKETRVDLKIAQTNVDMAEKDIKIARGAYQPHLSGFYSFSTRASDADRVAFNDFGVPTVSGPKPLFDQFSDNKGHSFGIQLSVPIFNGFSARNNVFRSKIALERTKLTLQQREQDLEKTVYTAFSDTKGAQKSFEAATTTLDARQKAMNYAKERYEVGLMNVFDYNQTQTMFVNAQSEVLRTKYDYIFRTKILEFYFGIPLLKK